MALSVRIRHTSMAPSLTSEGLIIADDASAALYHESTRCDLVWTLILIDEAHQTSSSTSTRLNICSTWTVAASDKEGKHLILLLLTNLSDGKNFGCIFDGVSSGGRASVYAAQAFTLYTLKWLSENSTKFIQGRSVNEDLAKQLFLGCCSTRLNAMLTSASDGGSATGAFVISEARGRRGGVINGACIGDCSVVVLHAVGCMARMVSPVSRSDPRDPGGLLMVNMGVDGIIWTFSEPVAPDDLVFLLTDGVTDNIDPGELARLLPLIIRSSFFDEVPAAQCPCLQESPRHLPCVSHLRKIVPEASIQALDFILPACASVRLFNYVKWVTQHAYETEQDYYGKLIRLRDGMGKAGESEREMLAVKAEISALEKDRAKSGLVEKTDDAAILVMKPFNKLAH